MEIPWQKLRIRKFYEKQMYRSAGILIFVVVILLSQSPRLSGSLESPVIHDSAWKQYPLSRSASTWSLYRILDHDRHAGWLIVAWHQPVNDSSASRSVTLWEWPNFTSNPRLLAGINWSPDENAFVVHGLKNMEKYWPWSVVRSIPAAQMYAIMPTVKGWHFAISLVRPEIFTHYGIPISENPRLVNPLRFIRAQKRDASGRELLWDFWIENKPDGKIVLARINQNRIYQFVDEWTDAEWIIRNESRLR